MTETTKSESDPSTDAPADVQAPDVRPAAEADGAAADMRPDATASVEAAGVETAPEETETEDPAADQQGDNETGEQADAEQAADAGDQKEEPAPDHSEVAPAPEKEVSAALDIRLPEGVELPSDAPVPIDPSFRVRLPNFEGPLDLLLFLIKKHELDILDLPIAFITERYVETMRLMETLNLDIAAEYLVMAATLAHIKSKSLLPKAPDDEDDFEEDGIDPREELIRRLLAYQKYKKAAEELGSRGVAGRDVFPRGIPAPKAEGQAPLAEVSVFKLIDVFQKILERNEGKLAFEIDAEQITIQERMGQITEMIQQRERIPFEELFEGYATTYDLVVSFLALLEMAKMRLLRVFQTNPDGTIYLEARILDVDAPTDEGAVAAALADPHHDERVAAAMDELNAQVGEMPPEVADPVESDKEQA